MWKKAGLSDCLKRFTEHCTSAWKSGSRRTRTVKYGILECRPMPNAMVALPIIGGALCSTPRSLAVASLLDCRAVTLPRRETGWNLLGCPKLKKRFQPLVGRSSPYCEDMWGRYCCLTSFFPIVDTSLRREDIARQSCAMVPRRRFLATFLGPAFALLHRATIKILCHLSPEVVSVTSGRRKQEKLANSGSLGKSGK